MLAGCRPDEPPPVVSEEQAVSEEPAVPADSFIDLPGARLHYLDWGGEGDLLLFVPGIRVTAHAWNRIAPHFTDRFRVIAVTRREHGLSERRGDAFDMDTLANDLANVIAAFSDGPAIVVGWSWAGRELPVLARQHPDRIKALVFVDALNAAGEKPADVPDPPARGYAFPDDWSPPGRPSAPPDSLAMRRFRALVKDWSPALYDGIRAPTLLIRVERGNAGVARYEAQGAPADTVEQLRRFLAWQSATSRRATDAWVVAVPGTQVVVLDSVTHNVPVEDPEVLIAVLEPFLESQRTRSRTR
jgi:pimeloyl-ACP methyl ester carboxylesterase